MSLKKCQKTHIEFGIRNANMATLTHYIAFDTAQERHQQYRSLVVSDRIQQLKK